MSRDRFNQGRKVSSVRGGRLVLAAYAEHTTYSSHTTVIPIDDTVPQNNEGDEILTASITPHHANNRLRVTVHGQFVTSLASIGGVFALFRDAVTGAVRATYGLVGATNHSQPFSVVYEVVAGSTAPTTFKLRVGPNTGTLYINGDASVRRLGGAQAVTMVIEEVEP